MCLHGMRAARGRLLASVVAIVLCLSSSLADARAQDFMAAGPAGISSAGETVLLRESPGYDAAVLANVPDGSSLDVTGAPIAAADGSSWLPVVIGGQSGYVPAGYVTSAPPAQAADAATAAPLNAATTAPVGNPVAPVTDPGMTAAGQAPPAGDPPAATVDPNSAAPLSSTGATTTDANLRAGPSAESAVLQVLPPGAPVAINGAAENGFVPVTSNGATGWLAADLIGGETTATLPPPLVATDTTTAAEPVATAAPAPVTTAPTEQAATEPLESLAPAPNVSDGQSTGIVWPFAGGEWEVVQGYNNGTHTNRGGFAQYKYSLDWARTDGNTAGEPVYAPVSGTIRWIDRGSGGMLIDAGNGYGVAVFHVTIDRGLARGGQVERGQQIGRISGPGGDGYMSMAHIEIACWKLSGGGHESVPFTGPNAIAGQEFPDSGGTNQHMGARVTP